MSMPQAFILHAKTRPERADAFAAFFLEHVAASRAEAGCIEYHMLRDRQDPSLFIFYEVWARREALEIHSSLPHMQQFLDARMDYLEQDFEIRAIDMLSPAATGR